MSDEEIKYLRSIKKLRPSIDVFKKLVQILASVQEKTDQLLKSSLSAKV